jgi:chemotaxis methyl-accepting protein methylase
LQAVGGLTLAQSPDSARFTGMPEAAIAARVVDHVLEPEEIGGYLARRGILGQILRAVERATGTDFSGYKEETIWRRLQRRLQDLGLQLGEYLGYTERNRKELAILQRHFLVSLSSFFRDRDSFQVLAAALRKLLAGRTSVRIWVPGCAGGEEAYSLAILASQILGPGGKIWIQGSDLNAEALERARAGSYPPSSLQEVDPELVDRHFTRTGPDYTVSEAFRGMCQFVQQDVMRGPAPGDLDLISCRNLLIYLQEDWQTRLLEVFQRNLRPEGLLFIGPSETTGIVGASYFKPVDHHHRLYRRRSRVL